MENGYENKKDEVIFKFWKETNREVQTALKFSYWIKKFEI